MKLNMKTIFDYIHKFKFKNFLALVTLPALLYMLYTETTLRDLLIVLVTLLFRYYWDSSTGTEKKDDTINNMAKSIPDAQNNTINEKV